MSESKLALLLLPDPPQRLSDLGDIRAALYPPLDAAVAFLNKSSRPSILEIALPIFRLVRIFRKRRSLFANVSVLLANVYSLLESIYQQHSLSLSSTNPVDARVVLVIDDENLFESSQTMPCGTVMFGQLARCRRNWTHIFVVESEHGLARHRNFVLMAGEERSEWRPMTVRIPGSLQFFFPDKLFDAQGSLNTPLEGPFPNDILIAIDPSTFGFIDKYTLTMGLFAVDPEPPRRPTKILGDGISSQRKIHVATIEGETTTPVDVQIEQQKRVIDFLLALLDIGKANTVVTYASKADTLDVSFPLSSIEQKFRIRCLVSTQRCDDINEQVGVTTIIVTGRNSGVVEEINKIRSARGWDELMVVRLEDIRASELAIVHETTAKTTG